MGENVHLVFNNGEEYEHYKNRNFELVFTIIMWGIAVGVVMWLLIKLGIKNLNIAFFVSLILVFGGVIYFKFFRKNRHREQYRHNYNRRHKRY